MKKMLSIVGYLVVFVSLLFLLYMTYRNFVVYNERTKLIVIMSAMNGKEIDNGTWSSSNRWRSNALDLYSYNKMLWQLNKFKWSFKDVEEYYRSVMMESGA